MDIAPESTVETKRVNFLDFNEKALDWRYEFHRSHFMKSVSKTIYWVGTIDLSEVDKNTKTVALSFCRLPGAVNSMKDAETRRHEDGAPTEHSNVYQYFVDDPDLKKEILDAKNEGMSFFHILLEETCDGYGAHSVDLVYGDNGNDSIRGFGSTMPLSDMPLRQCYWLSSLPIGKYTLRIQLLGHDRYHWHK